MTERYARLETLQQNVTKNVLSQNYVNLLHPYHVQSSVKKTIPKVIIKKNLNLDSPSLCFFFFSSNLFAFRDAV